VHVPNGAKIRVFSWYFRDSLNRIGALADTSLIGDVPLRGAVVFHGLHSTGESHALALLI
jgi:hypothetical protein